MLLSVSPPADWSATELDDGSTIHLRSHDVDARIMLLPTRLLDGLSVEVPVSPAPEVLAERLVPMLSARDGVTVDSPRVDWVGTWQALTLAEGQRASGEVLIFELAPGILAIASWSPTRDREAAVDAARAVIGSVQLTASVDDVVTAVDAPPPPDFPTI